MTQKEKEKYTIFCSLLRAEVKSRKNGKAYEWTSKDKIVLQLGVYFKSFAVDAAYEPSKEQVALWLNEIKSTIQRHKKIVAMQTELDMKGYHVTAREMPHYESMKETILDLIEKKVNQTIQIAA